MWGRKGKLSSACGELVVFFAVVLRAKMFDLYLS